MFDLLYNFKGLNSSLFLYLNKLTNQGPVPNILKFISLPFFIANFALYFSVICIILYFKLRNMQSTNFKTERFWIYYYKMVGIGIIYTCFGLLYTALKFGVNLPRPYCSLPEHSFQTIANIDYERCLSSFPSAHTGLALLILYFAWEYLNKFQRICGGFIIALVALSRISLAMHYPADILYSLIIAVLVILIGQFIFKIFKNPIIDEVGIVLLKSLL